MGINAALNPLLNCNALPVGSTICIYYDSAFCGYNSYVYAIRDGDTCKALGLNPLNFPQLNCNGLTVSIYLFFFLLFVLFNYCIKYKIAWTTIVCTI